VSSGGAAGSVAAGVLLPLRSGVEPELRTERGELRCGWRRRREGGGGYKKGEEGVSAVRGGVVVRACAAHVDGGVVAWRLHGVWVRRRFPFSSPPPSGPR
jgi:hypothetical protein